MRRNDSDIDLLELGTQTDGSQGLEYHDERSETVNTKLRAQNNHSWRSHPKLKSSMSEPGFKQVMTIIREALILVC